MLATGRLGSKIQGWEGCQGSGARRLSGRSTKIACGRKGCNVRLAPSWPGSNKASITHLEKNVCARVRSFHLPHPSVIDQRRGSAFARLRRLHPSSRTWRERTSLCMQSPKHRPSYGLRLDLGRPSVRVNNMFPLNSATYRSTKEYCLQEQLLYVH